MTDIDTDIRDALDRATRHLDVRPDLLQDVRRGGQKRVIRRRTVLGGALAAAAAGGAGTLLWPRGEGPEPTGSWLLDRPTTGDLARDERYLRQVRKAWERAYGDPATRAVMRGEPHIVWAGSTPAGPAAYVTQRYTDPGSALAMAAAFVEPAPGGPAVLWQSNYVPGDPSTTLPRATLMGATRNVLVILDTGEPTRFSAALRYLPDGRIRRDFAAVPFTGGAAVLSVPRQGPESSIALLSGSVAAPRPVPIVNVGDVDKTSNGAAQNHRALPDPAKVWPAGGGDADAEADSWSAGPLRPYQDLGGYQPQVAGPGWVIRATTPDGRRLSLRTPSAYDSRQRVLVLLGSRRGPVRVHYMGELNPTAPLPIAVRLPDGQGVLVAGEDVKLRYRAARGDWLAVKGDAALLPRSAARIHVTTRTGRQVELDLP
jgi:hypothetical protein